MACAGGTLGSKARRLEIIVEIRGRAETAPHPGAVGELARGPNRVVRLYVGSSSPNWTGVLWGEGGVV